MYMATHTLIGRRAAIKVLLPKFSNDQQIVRRFFREAQGMAKLGHPGIADIFDFGTDKGGQAYLIMEYLDGEPLSVRLKRRGPMPVPEALSLFDHLVSALGAAHQQDIVHRDLKPANIMLVADPGVRFGERPKILDFGIAKLADAGTDTSLKTATNVVMGTPSYMAPEQCRGAGAVDHRADLYSLGCILFHILCGRPPFVGEGIGEVIGMQQFVRPPSPRSLDPSIPARLDALVLKLLAKDPAARPATTNEIRAELSDIVNAEHPTHADAKQPASNASGPHSPLPNSEPGGRSQSGPQPVFHRAKPSAPRPSAPRPADGQARPSSPYSVAADPHASGPARSGSADPHVSSPARSSTADPHVSGPARSSTADPHLPGDSRNISPPSTIGSEWPRAVSPAAQAAPALGQAAPALGQAAPALGQAAPTTLGDAASQQIQLPRRSRRWIAIASAALLASAAGIAVIALTEPATTDVVASGATDSDESGNPSSADDSDESSGSTSSINQSATESERTVGDPSAPRRKNSAADSLPGHPAESDAPIRHGPTPSVATSGGSEAGRSGQTAKPADSNRGLAIPQTEASTSGQGAPGDRVSDPPADSSPVADQPEVDLTIESRPSGATVFLAGNRLGETPHVHRAVKQMGTLVFEIKLRAYQTQRVTLQSDEDGRKLVTLKRKSRPSSRSKASERRKNSLKRDETLDPFGTAK